MTNIAAERREAVETTKARHLTLLEREIRAKVNDIHNAIGNRRNHPTYGYTKAGINERYHHLEALLGVYGLLAGLQNHAGVATPAAEILGVDLRAIRDEIKAV